MNTTQFETLYLTHEPEIKASLLNQRIFDEDLFQDTCLELCEFAQHNAIRNFPGLFIERYKKLLKRQGQRQLDIVPYDNAQLAALDIIDESQDVAILDRDIDCDYAPFPNQNMERLHELLNRYFTHPHPEERNHRRACRILRLYLADKSEREIAHCLRISHQAVHQSLMRIIARLKVATM
jgi:DNA-binding CsgD family transcriptional regulator